MHARSLSGAVLALSVATTGLAQSDRALLLDHYQRVERELADATCRDADPATAARRRAAIDALRAYRLTGEFGVQSVAPWSPRFIDAEGRRCAVAALIDASGYPALTRSVGHGAGNELWVADLARAPELLDWLGRHGLTLAEAARIQAPSVGGGGSWGGRSRRGPRERQLEALRTQRESASRTVVSPGDAAPRPSGASSARTSLAAGQRSGGGSAPGGVSTNPGTGGISFVDLPVEDWRAWWEWNRLAVLDELGTPRSAEASEGQAQTDETSRSRALIEPILREALSDPVGGVRASAVLAYADAFGAESVAVIRPLLEDSNVHVREYTILALGAAGGGEAIHKLCSIASGLRREGGQQISEISQPLAVIALGLARGRGASASLDSFVRDLTAASTRSAAHEQLELAALLYQRLAPNARLDALVDSVLADKDASRMLRCCAIESLGVSDRAATLGRLLDLRYGRDVALRQSAALSLGEHANDLAAPSLLTSFELEREQLAKGFSLIAIGRRADEAGGAFLREQLAEGPRSLRSWAAVGLGLWARARTGPEGDEARKALIAGLDVEANRDARGAYLLALGIAQDPDVVARSLEILREGKESTSRSAAAEALSLSKSPRAAEVLRDSIDNDGCPDVRARAAEALARHGDPRDIDRLVKELESTIPAFRPIVVRGLAHVRDARVLDALLRIAEESAPGDDELRAAIVRALGSVASDHEGERLAQLGVSANYTMFPSWLGRVVGSGL